MRKDLLSFALLMCLATTFVGCNDTIETAEECPQQPKRYIRNLSTKEYLASLPTLSVKELDALSADSTVLNFRTARQYAYTELFSCLHLFLNERRQTTVKQQIEHGEYPQISLTMGDLPVVVYDYDNRPYYYEFPVLFNDTVVRTITVCAQPIDDEVIDFIFHPLQYTSLSRTYKRYVGEYPNVYYGDGTQTLYMQGQSENGAFCLQPIEKDSLISLIPDKQLAQCLSQMQYEDVELLDANLRDGGHEISDVDVGIFDACQSVKDFPSEIHNFMQASYSLPQIISAYPPVTLKDTFVLTYEQFKMIYDNLHRIQTTRRFSLPQYNRAPLIMTFWWGACGPSAMAWLYRGIFDSYKGKYLPLFEQVGASYVIDYEKEFYRNEQNYAYYSFTYKFPFPKIPYSLYPRVKERSEKWDNGLYYVWFKRTIPNKGGNALFPVGMNKGMKEATKNKYCTELTTHPFRELESNLYPLAIAGQQHIFAAIGTGYTKKGKDLYKNKYFLIYDNGYWSEEFNHYPFWRKYKPMNLHYVVKPANR